MKAQYLRLAFLAVSLVSAVNCGNVHFGQNSSSSNGKQGSPNDGDAVGAIGSNGNNGGGDSTNGAVNQPGAGPGGTDLSDAGGTPGPITGTGNSSAAILPKVVFIGPPCQRLTNCAITFQLDKAYPKQVEFDWKTRDDLFGKPADPGAYPWGQPDVQYVRTSGHLVFAPNVTSLTVYVRNINPQETPISIGVQMSKCAYNSLQESCQKFFAP